MSVGASDVITATGAGTFTFGTPGVSASHVAPDTYSLCWAHASSAGYVQIGNLKVDGPDLLDVTSRLGTIAFSMSVLGKGLTSSNTLAVASDEALCSAAAVSFDGWATVPMSVSTLVSA
jgi:hypothetical protein